MKCFVLISQKFTANYVIDYPDFHLSFLELFGKVSFYYGVAKQILGTSFYEKSLRANFFWFYGKCMIETWIFYVQIAQKGIFWKFERFENFLGISLLNVVLEMPSHASSAFLLENNWR